MSRIGGLIAPFVVAADFMGESSSLIIYGLVALVSGILALDLPETHGKPLPQTIFDVNGLEKKV